MKTIIFLIAGIGSLLGTVQQINHNTQLITNSGANISKLVKQECDDEPIFVRGHLSTVGGTPINGASVKLKQGGVVKYQTTTTSSGDYSFASVPTGNYQLHLSASGYVTKTVNLTFSADVERTDTLIAQ